MKIFLLFAALISSNSFAAMFEACQQETSLCQIVKVDGANFTFYSSTDQISQLSVDFGNTQLALYGLNNQSAVSVSPEEYARLKALASTPPVGFTRDDLRTNLNMTPKERREILSCSFQSIFCAGSIGLLAVTKVLGAGLVITSCTSAVDSCAAALEIIDEYHERVKENMKALEELDAEEKNAAKPTIHIKPDPAPIRPRPDFPGPIGPRPNHGTPEVHINDNPGGGGGCGSKFNHLPCHAV